MSVFRVPPFVQPVTCEEEVPQLLCAVVHSGRPVKSPGDAQSSESASRRGLVCVGQWKRNRNKSRNRGGRAKEGEARRSNGENGVEEEERRRGDSQQSDNED